MREFQERRRMKKFLHSRYAIALLALVCLVLGKGVWSAFDKYEKSKELAERTRAELADLVARENSLASSTAALATEQGKEKEIRDRFGLTKAGEKMAVIVDDATTGTSGSGEAGKSWWDWLTGLFTRD